MNQEPISDEAEFRLQVGSRIKQHRNRMGLSAEAVSEMMRVSRNTVFGWESGRQLPAGPKMVQLANLYGVSIDQLLGRLERGDETLLMEEAELALRSASDQLTPEDVKSIRDYIQFVHERRRREALEADDEG